MSMKRLVSYSPIDNKRFHGPVYGVDLFERLPCGELLFSCPLRDDLERAVASGAARTVSSYEILSLHLAAALALVHRSLDRDSVDPESDQYLNDARAFLERFRHAGAVFNGS